MSDRSIIIYNGGWITNIGNAFIDFGARSCLQDVYGPNNADIHLTSTASSVAGIFMNSGIRRWVGSPLGKDSHPLTLLSYARASYIVLAGAILSHEFLELCGPSLQKAREETGARIVLLGVGLSEKAYSRKGIEAAKQDFKRLDPYVFVSRDEMTFSSFKDIAPHTYNGIDVGFFVADDYRPPAVSLPPYVVLNFDRLHEPESLPAQFDGLRRIRTHHTFWLNFPARKWIDMKKQYYGKDSTLISDFPHDYLTLYASSQATFADRVHACVATLAYGRSAMLYSKSPRSGLFDRVGARTIKETVTTLNSELIVAEKEKMVEFLRDLL